MAEEETNDKLKEETEKDELEKKEAEKEKADIAIETRLSKLANFDRGRIESNLITRRHSDDLTKPKDDKNFKISIYTPSDDEDEKEKDKDDNENEVVTRSQSQDTAFGLGLKSKPSGLVSEISIVKMERSYTDENMVRTSSKENNQSEIVVPSRKIISKYPFYSTMLTVESTNNAFFDFMSRLTEMGYGEQAEAALVYTNAESVEMAIDYIINNPLSIWHKFIPTDNDENTCATCNMPKNKHLIDSKGKKISNDDDNSNQGTKLLLLSSVSIDEPDLKTEDKKDINTESNGTKKVEKYTALKTFMKKLEENPTTSNSLTVAEDKGPTQLCYICFENKPEKDFFIAPCNHNYCKECLFEHYKVKTNSGDVLKVSCIDPKCEREIPPSEFKSFIEKDKALLSKYEKFRKDKLLMLNSSARFCVKPDCPGYIIGSALNRLNPKLTCGVCGTNVCYNCSRAWHGYFTSCNSNVDIGYSAWALNKNIQKCPQCRIRIEKNEGCNHMTCQACHYEFCWVCRGKYSDTHFAPWNLLFGCPGFQYAPKYMRCPSFCPRWLNRVMMILFVIIFSPLILLLMIMWGCSFFFTIFISCGDRDCGFDPFEFFADDVEPENSMKFSVGWVGINWIYSFFLLYVNTNIQTFWNEYGQHRGHYTSCEKNVLDAVDVTYYFNDSFIDFYGFASHYLFYTSAVMGLMVMFKFIGENCEFGEFKTLYYYIFYSNLGLTLVVFVVTIIMNVFFNTIKEDAAKLKGNDTYAECSGIIRSMLDDTNDTLESIELYWILFGSLWVMPWACGVCTHVFARDFRVNEDGEHLRSSFIKYTMIILLGSPIITIFLVIISGNLDEFWDIYDNGNNGNCDNSFITQGNITLYSTLAYLSFSFGILSVCMVATERGLKLTDNCSCKYGATELIFYVIYFVSFAIHILCLIGVVILSIFTQKSFSSLADDSVNCVGKYRNAADDVVDSIDELWVTLFVFSGIYSWCSVCAVYYNHIKDNM